MEGLQQLIAACLTAAKPYAIGAAAGLIVGIVIGVQL